MPAAGYCNGRVGTIAGQRESGQVRGRQDGELRKKATPRHDGVEDRIGGFESATLVRLAPIGLSSLSITNLVEACF